MRWPVYVAASLVAFGAGLVRGGGDGDGRATVEQTSEPSRRATARAPGSPVPAPKHLERRSGAEQRASASGLARDLDAMRAAGLSAEEIAERQPRDADWARDVERFFTSELEVIRQELLPYAVSARIECRSTLCRLRVLVPTSDWREAHFLLQVLQFGEGLIVMARAAEREGYVEVGGVIHFDPSARVLATIAARFQAKVSERFALGYRYARRWFDEHGLDGLTTPEER